MAVAFMEEGSIHHRNKSSAPTSYSPILPPSFLKRRSPPLALLTRESRERESVWRALGSSSPPTMRAFSGSFHPCSALRSFFSDKVGGALINCKSPIKCGGDNQKLEKKLTEAIKKKAALKKQSFRSMNSIIMRFPQFKDGLRSIKNIFEQYDEDSNGTIDREELKKCLSALEVDLTEKEINDLYHYCDVDGNEGIQFNEFIVVLCLIYVLMGPASATDYMSRIGPPQVEATFDAIVDAFLFVDKNGDGKVKRKDLMLAFNEVTTQEKSPNHVTLRRFKEMDWNKDGKVTFKEFLFSLTKWVGMDTNDQESLK